MKCLIDGVEFEPKRSTAKYCSDKCRKLAFQNVPELDAKNAKTQNAKKPTNRIEGYEDFVNDGCSHIEGIDTCTRSYCPNFKGLKYYEKFPRRQESLK